MQRVRSPSQMPILMPNLQEVCQNMQNNLARQKKCMYLPPPKIPPGGQRSPPGRPKNFVAARLFKNHFLSKVLGGTDRFGAPYRSGTRPPFSLSKKVLTRLAMAFYGFFLFYPFLDFLNFPSFVFSVFCTVHPGTDRSGASFFDPFFDHK